MRLNNQQRELAEANHNLIYSFMKRYHLDIEDWYGEMAISYCKAIYNYDPTACELSTYIYKILKNDMINILVAEKTQKREKPSMISLDTILNDESIEVSELLGAEDEGYQNLDKEMMISRYKKIFTKSENEVFEYMLNGYTQSEVARLMNVSRQNVGSLVSSIRERVKNANEKIN